MPRFIESPAAGLVGYLHTTPHHVIFMAECRTCGRATEMPRGLLKKAQIGLEGLHEMGKRLRCASCGEQNAKLMTGFYYEESKREDR